MWKMKLDWKRWHLNIDEFRLRLRLKWNSFKVDCRFCGMPTLSARFVSIAPIRSLKITNLSIFLELRRKTTPLFFFSRELIGNRRKVRRKSRMPLFTVRFFCLNYYSLGPRRKSKRSHSKRSRERSNNQIKDRTFCQRRPEQILDLLLSPRSNRASIQWNRSSIQNGWRSRNFQNSFEQIRLDERKSSFPNNFMRRSNSRAVRRLNKNSTISFNGENS